MSAMCSILGCDKGDYLGLGGTVLFFGGMWLTDWGFRRQPLSIAHVAGWLAFVVGGVILLLEAIICVAEMVSF